MPLVLPVSAADVHAIKANNDGFARPRRRRLRRGHDIRLHNGLTDPHASVPHRAPVRRPADGPVHKDTIAVARRGLSNRCTTRYVDSRGWMLASDLPPPADRSATGPIVVSSVRETA
jgi:hypothetical protein